MKKLKVNQITIVGLGFMGGSLGMDLRRFGIAKKVMGLSRSMRTARKAVQVGAIDEGSTIPLRAVAEADIVVLATPVDTIAAMGLKLAPLMPRGSILTDIGSTKAEIVGALADAMPKGVAFIGSHPVAGSDKSGVGAAREGLFAGTSCVITPTKHTPERVIQRMRRFWESIGQDVVSMQAAQHDRLLAASSHMPHLVSSCLAMSMDAKGLPKVPKSMMEMTRLANGDPDLWDDILLSNRDAILKCMERFSKDWDKLYDALDKESRGAIRRQLARGQRKRKQFVQQNK